MVTFSMEVLVRQPQKKRNNPPQKGNSHRAPSMMQTKICTYYGRSVVGTALVESGFGRETPFSAERGLSSKVFILSQGYSQYAISLATA